MISKYAKEAFPGDSRYRIYQNIIHNTTEYIKILFWKSIASTCMSPDVNVMSETRSC